MSRTAPDSAFAPLLKQGNYEHWLRGKVLQAVAEAGAPDAPYYYNEEMLRVIKQHISTAPPRASGFAHSSSFGSSTFGSSTFGNSSFGSSIFGKSSESKSPFSK